MIPTTLSVSCVAGPRPPRADGEDVLTRFIGGALLGCRDEHVVDRSGCVPVRLYCLDWNGEVLWERDLGDMHTKHGHGEGSSPALHGDILVVNWDHEGPSFVAAFDKRTGTELWRKQRDEPTSWSSPHVVVHEGSPQLVIAAANRIRSYKLTNGDLIWECGGLSHNVVAGPVSDDGILIAGSSYEKQAIMGIRLTGATGDITGTKQRIWIKRRDTPYVPSLLLHDGLVYYLRHYQGVLTCLDIKTGEQVPLLHCRSARREMRPTIRATPQSGNVARHRPAKRRGRRRSE